MLGFGSISETPISTPPSYAVVVTSTATVAATVGPATAAAVAMFSASGISTATVQATVGGATAQIVATFRASPTPTPSGPGGGGGGGFVSDPSSRKWRSLKEWQEQQRRERRQVERDLAEVAVAESTAIDDDAFLMFATAIADQF